MIRIYETTSDRGHVLLAALMVLIMLGLLSMTLLYLAAQDAPGIPAMREQTQGLHLAEGAADLVLRWFHEPSAAPPTIGDLLMKRADAGDGPSYFDATGHSQFVGTPERPDIFLDASNESDARVLNGATGGFTGALSELGRLDQVKLYAPVQPGLLGTIEVTASTRGRRPLASTIRVQLGALNIPAIRAAVQTGQGLGAASGGASKILAHWGDIRAMGDILVNQTSDLVTMSVNAPVTGQAYATSGVLEDRWVQYWIGGQVSFLSPSASDTSGFPANVHTHQQPTPGIRIDQWDYDLLKRAAHRHGTYYRLGRDGLLRHLGASEYEPGLMPADVFGTSTVGHSHGLIFIDTVDGEPPTADNLGTLALDIDYVEALLVVQGHVVLKPSGPGRTMTVLSPPPQGSMSLSGRIPTTLSGIHLNGLLYAAGTVTVERETHVYGAVAAAGSLMNGSATSRLEVWYNSDFSKGFFRGLPVVYRAPATYDMKY